MVAMLAGDDFVGGFHDRVRQLRVQAAGRFVCERRGLLDPDLGEDKRLEGTQAADGKILDGTQRLDAIQRVAGNLLFTEWVLLGPEARHMEVLAPARNGLEASSSAMVVAGPWPGYTTVSGSKL